jgi:hypothetical protein
MVPNTETKRLDLLLLPCLLLAVLLAYTPTLTGGFILDDFPLVKENPFIRSFHSPAVYLAQEDGTPMDCPGDYHSGYYRPLINVLYTLDYKIWGLDPGKLRATNLFLHLLTCTILYALLRCFFACGAGPFWGALFFGLHPANTESVSWIAARNNVAVTFLVLLSFYLYLKRTRDGKIWAGFLSLGFFFLALLAKEFAVMLLPIIFLRDRLLGKTSVQDVGPFYGYTAFLLVFVCYLFLKQYGTSSILQLDGPGHLFQSLYFAPYVFTFNLRVIFWPYGLHNFIVAYPADWMGWEAIAGFFGVGISAWMVWRLRRNRILLFSFLSFGAALFPVLHIVPTAAVSLVAMRWLYFPMVFLCIAGAWAVAEYVSPGKQVFTSIVLGTVALYLASYTFVLNENLWKHENRFFKQEVLGFDNRFYLADLATIYHSEGRLGDAFRFFQMALAKQESHEARIQLYVNYAALLLDLSRPRDALIYLERAERLRPRFEDLAGLYNNKGVAYFKMGDYSRAVPFFMRAIRIEPDGKDFLVNLGNAYSVLKRFPEAVSSYLQALEVGADPVAVRKVLGRTYLAMGNYKNALKTLEKLSLEVVEKEPEISRMLQEARQGAGEKDSLLHIER